MHGTKLTSCVLSLKEDLLKANLNDKEWNENEKEARISGDEVYERLGEVMGGLKKGENIYRTYLDAAMGEVIVIGEHPHQLSSGTTGLSCWQASSVLADLICSDSFGYQMKGKSILELGAGCGLAGIAGSKFGKAKNVIMSDVNEKVLQQLDLNISLNKLSQQVQVLHLDWTSPPPHFPQQLDFIIAADVVYDVGILPCLVDVVEKLLRQNEGAVFIICSTLRNQDTMTAFECLIETTSTLSLVEKKIIPPQESLLFPLTTTITCPTILHVLKTTKNTI
uniref:FAM86 domain-containing protein n=1 Tax=Rhabditophanes sp. KR3021 TaxID=114890 RepID=A0AC35TIU9_9BILA